MRDEHGNTVRDRNRHTRSAVEREVPVRVSAAQPAFPPGSVRDHTVAVHLPCGREPRACSRAAHRARRIPARHDVANRLVAQPRRSCRRARVVVKARMPIASRSGTRSYHAATTRGSTLRRHFRRSSDSSDPSAERVETLVDALVAALDLAGVVDRARALRAQRGQEHRHSGANVRRLDRRSAQRRGSRNERTVRIAQHDARPHADQLVDEEHSRLEHLFVEENDAPCTGWR